jgi:hypothetical protein
MKSGLFSAISGNDTSRGLLALAAIQQHSFSETAPSRFKTVLETGQSEAATHYLQSRHTMEHTYHIDDHVLRQSDGPQGREVVEQSNVYTILALLPVEADGRLRYRIKSKEENFERVVTEDALSHLN